MDDILAFTRQLVGSSTPGSSTPGSSPPGSSTPGSSTPGISTPGRQMDKSVDDFMLRGRRLPVCH